MKMQPERNYVSQNVKDETFRPGFIHGKVLENSSHVFLNPVFFPMTGETVIALPH
jgi:hypothetical protein